MQFKVFFTTGQQLIISQERYLSLIGNQNNTIDTDGYINLDFVTHIIPEQEGESAVITQPTPETIKEAERRKTEEIIADPAKVLADLKPDES